MLDIRVKKIALLFFATLFFSVHVFADEEPGIHGIPMTSYRYLNFDAQTVHIPGIGFGVTAGDYGNGFTSIHNSFFGMGLYQPVIFSGRQKDEVYHQIDVLLDGRIERHQFLGIFRSASDKPVSGGLHTFQAGAGWGYEIIRNSHVSFVAGFVAAAGDFGFPSPVLPLLLLRFGIDTTWVNVRFDFLTGPNLSMIIAPEKRLRFTADLHMDYYRGIEDLLGDCTLWYRFFDKDSAAGDRAGLGIGIKNNGFCFDLSASKDRKYELQYSAVFGVFDMSVLKIEAGYIFDSRTLVDEQNAGSPGKGFYVALQGMCQF
ncbi:MAG: hypothetical protein LBD31_08100 [Treponema sp.]|jgi:hypothetical protein|nr:hypothetical protein [Treponema sp.]